MSLERLVDFLSERKAVRPLPLFLLYLLTRFTPLIKTAPTTTIAARVPTLLSAVMA